ncbi:hypothetical protein ACFQ46_09225 [Kineococcus sp. GCM10028916]|uniref:hypothetical protein n=1 Tax=Kineococcus sp. GCM10028916 TaxID=3273394 RepID=UPI003644FF91
MIGWYAHHQGSGHVQRLRAVAEHLRTPVTALSSAPRPADWGGGWVQLEQDDTEPLDRRRVDAGGRLHWVPAHHPGLAARTARIATWIATTRPALVVVDVSVEVTLLARLCGVPVVVAAMLGDRDDPAHRLGRDVARALLAPWPEPADPAPGSGTPVVHVGAFSRFDGRPTVEPVPGTVLVLWGSGGRDVSDDDFRRAREATPGWTWEYLVPGRGDRPVDVWDALQRNEVVVVHGGHNAVAEVAAARRPAVVVAQERPFGEQRRRAALLRAEGITALDEWPEPGAWPELLVEARAVGTGPWKRWAPGDGAARAARFLDDLADREGGA